MSVGEPSKNIENINPKSDQPSSTDSTIYVNAETHGKSTENIQKAVSSIRKTEQWQRISIIGIAYFLVAFFRNVFGNIVYLAPALLLFYNKINENPNFWLPFLYGFLALALVYAGLSFYFFQYRLTNKSLEIRQGVFAKKSLNLPFTKIQNIELTEPLYYRPFGYTCMKLDTAGSIKQEAKVVALKKDFAIELKQQILFAHARQHPVNEQGASREGQESLDIEKEEVLDRRNLDDLVIHGITNNRVWIFVGGLLPFIDNISDKLGQWLLQFGVNVEQYFEFDGKSGWQIATTALSLALMIIIPMTIFSILGSIIAFHNFTLSKVGDRYIRRSGLFTRNEVTMRLSRLQMIVRQQDWLDVILRRMNLRLEQSNANFKSIEPGGLSNKILVPSVTNKECTFLINDLYPNNQLNQIAFKRVHIRLLLRNILLIVLPIASLGFGLMFYHQDFRPTMVFSAVLAILTTIIVCRYLRWGYAIDDEHIYVRKGCFGVNYYLAKKYKLQQTKFLQSWFLKRKNLCSVELILASGMLKVPYIDANIGRDIIDDCLYNLEKSKRNWM
ncbi:PH domain-containing protein [Thalassotalea aquiviva]|uniref:PH domain-containing protein n=1 Tax=Thalassotalea aquiviva TaxID=3242415 RepID=UPI003529FF1F